MQEDAWSYYMYFYCPVPDGLLVYRRDTPSTLQFARTLLYTRVEKGIWYFSVLPKNTTQRLQPGLWTRTGRSGVERTKWPRLPRRTTMTNLFLQFREAFWTESTFNHRPETRVLHVSNDILAKDFFIATRVNTTYRLITAFISVFLITEQTNNN